MRTLSWFSAGAASAVATKLMLLEGPCEAVYCETGSEHPDNERQAYLSVASDLQYLCGPQAPALMRIIETAIYNTKAEGKL